MKFQIDLLPREYKSLPADLTGFVLAAVAILLCLSWTVSSYMKNTSEQFKVQQQVDAAMKDLRDLNQRIGELQPPVAQINALKSSIEFINTNLDTPGTSWVDFLYAFESTVPERIYISDINPKDFSGKSGLTFTVNGEGATIYDVLDYVSSLQKSPNFSGVYLKQNSTRAIENGTVTSFILTFTYVPAGKK
ncbi:MAG TPA: PilN domain-containing protein [Candidatus Ozemobacteraceae bacterium]|jgi:hypothetical protein